MGRVSQTDTIQEQSKTLLIQNSFFTVLRAAVLRNKRSRSSLQQNGKNVVDSKLFSTVRRHAPRRASTYAHVLVLVAAARLWAFAHRMDLHE
jgi:hypothetical protein